MAKRPEARRFIPKNPEKYMGDPTNIITRSSWEYRFFVWCDTNSAVIQYASEERVVPYICKTDNRPHRYFPDALIKVRTKSGEVKTYLVEIKPDKETRPPEQPKNPKSKTYINAVLTYIKNKSKWEAARAWCDQRGIQFLILTEYDLGIAQRPSKA